MKRTIMLAAVGDRSCVERRVCTPQVPVPASFFGMHLHDMNSPWPDAPVGALAKGSQTAWAYIEPNPPLNGVPKFNWSTLDAWVAMAKAHGVDFYWSNAFVPRWAVSDVSPLVLIRR